MNTSLTTKSRHERNISNILVLLYLKCETVSGRTLDSITYIQLIADATRKLVKFVNSSSISIEESSEYELKRFNVTKHGHIIHTANMAYK